MAIIGPFKNGRYALRWRDARGKRHYETLKKMPYSRVKQEHAKRVANRDKERQSEATIARLCCDYLELHDVHAKHPLTELGRARAVGIADSIEEDPLGSVIAAEARPTDFLKWRLRRKAAGVSDATLDREWNFLRAALNLSVATEELSESPVKRGAVKRLVSSTEGKLIYFSPEEWRAFDGGVADDATWKAYVTGKRRFGPEKIGATGDKPRRYGAGRKPDSDSTREYRASLLALRPYFRALLWTGSRLSEIRLMTWEQVDFRGGYVTVTQGKGHGSRKIVPMSDDLRRDLEQLPRGIGKAYVFAQSSGEPYSKKQIERAFATYRAVAGLRAELTIHTIRHSFASWLVIAGRPIKEVQELLGHRSLTMTMRYVHLSPVHLRGAMTALHSVKNSTTKEDGSLREAGEE